MSCRPVLLACAPARLQILNPAETFGDIIVDYSYVECTSACITSLCAFRSQYPEHRPREIGAALARAERFIRDIQRPDGSWRVCDTHTHAHARTHARARACAAAARPRACRASCMHACMLG